MSKNPFDTPLATLGFLAVVLVIIMLAAAWGSLGETAVNECVARILSVEPEEVAGTDNWPRDLDATADEMMEIWKECR